MCLRVIVAATVFSVSGIISTVPTTLLAGGWQTEPGDTRFSQTELIELVAGKTISYEGGGKSVLGIDDSYEFHVGGKVYPYTYQITDDSEICIVSADYGARCDLIVKNGNQIVSINDKGERYPASIE